MATVADRSQKPLGARINGCILLALASLGLVGLYQLRHTEHVAWWQISSFVSLGVIGICRWTWFLLRLVRARIYRHGVFPQWRRCADRIPVTDLPPMCFLVPTYKEEPWVTERVFRAIAQEARTLAQPITLLVNSSGEAENAAIRAVLAATDPHYHESIRLIQMTQKDGKRQAMADALRYLATLNLPADTVIALMDGDSELAPGTLRQCLPFFRLFPNMGALTTDELPIVKGSYLFSEWFHLRFAQRHEQMCSDSLSRKVMCLTGRFSLFRADAAFHPSFAAQLENDTLDDWLWGNFKFLSGDDKSTWFWLLQRGYDMVYIPDALVYSIENLSGSVVKRAYQNMRRWYGNMLRNNGRAIAIGPRQLGWFTWYSLIDQRVSIWTSLLTPSFLIIFLCQQHWKGVGVVFSWVIFSRILMLWLVFWERQSDLKLIHFPILLITQWSSSIVKISTQMNLAKQNWSNRGNQSISAEGTGMTRVIKLGTARILLYCQLFGFGVLLCWLAGMLNPVGDIASLWLQQQVGKQPSLMVIEAGGANPMNTAIAPNDGQDDAKAIQAIIDQAPSHHSVQIQLPIGEIDLFYPLKIHDSNITLKGQGIGRTIVNVHFDHSLGEAALIVRPITKPDPAPLQNVQISGFSIRAVRANRDGNQAPTLGSILMENVENSSVRQLAIGHHRLILDHTKGVSLEYVTGDRPGTQGRIMLNNVTRTPPG